MSATLCQSGLWVWKVGDKGLVTPFPSILNHEGAGVVESVGEGVKLEIGVHVVPCQVPYCAKCLICKHPKGSGCYVI